MIRKFHLAANDAKQRLDQFLAAKLPEQSRSYLQKLIKSDRVTLDGQVINSNKSALPGSGVVIVDLPEITAENAPAAEEFSFELLYEDEFMAVINKPAGVVVHPAPGNSDGTVVNAILSRYPLNWAAGLGFSP